MKKAAKILILITLTLSLVVLPGAQMVFAVEIDPGMSGIVESGRPEKTDREALQEAQNEYGDAQTPPGEEDPEAPPSQNPENKEDGTPTKPSIPDNFEVSKYLKLDNQTSRVPAADAKGPTGITKLLVDAIDLLIKFIGAVALIVFIIGAILTIVSEGKEDRVEKGKTAMLYAVIGVVIALMSYIIVAFVQSILF